MARCTKIINPNSEDAKYVINVKQIAKVPIFLFFNNLFMFPFFYLIVVSLKISGITCCLRYHMLINCFVFCKLPNFFCFGVAMLNLTFCFDVDSLLLG